MLKDILRDRLQQDCSPEELRRWYDPLLLEYDTAAARLTVFFPHVHFAPWFAQEGQAAFERAVTGWFGEQGISPELAYHAAVMPPRRPPPKDAPPAAYTLDGFITNNKNAFPLAAARRVADPASGHAYNPFIVCGKSGTGKTHILRALAGALAAAHGGDAVFSGGVDELAAAVAAHGGSAFFRARQALVVDDLQRAARDAALQEQLIRIMDAFLDSRRQMIFACADTLASLRGLSEGLRSRLEVGLVVELKEPDLDVRLRFAQARCRGQGLKLERDHLLLLAQRCAQLRYLSGIVLKVAAFQSLEQRAITTADLENILHGTGDGRPVGPEDIVRTVAEHLKLTPKDILGGKRHPALVRARQIAMYLCREMQGTSYPALGRFFGGKDHSTVVHSIKKVTSLLVSDNDVQHLVTELKRKCSGR